MRVAGIARYLDFPAIPDLRKLTFLGIPCLSRLLRPVKDISVSGKLQYLHIAQPVSTRPLRNELRGRVKSL